MKPISLLSRVLGITLVMIAVSCQKEIPSSLTEDNLPTTENHQLKSTPNTANLDQLLIIIAEKVQSGEISKGNGNALTAKINSAKNNIQKGQLKAAENVLNAFINQVNTFVSDGVMTSELGQLLSTKANEVFNPPTWKCGDIFTDARDGKSYKSVLIGTQCWMGENLAYLPTVSPSLEGSDTYPFHYVYDYQGTDVGDAKTNLNYSIYGVLYNWPSALNACPTGWHLPTDEEWKVMEMNNGMSDIDANSYGLRFSGSVGGMLKEIGTDHWRSPNIGAVNSIGFTALPGGDRDNLAMFTSVSYAAIFWSNSETSLSNAYMRILDCNNDAVGRYRESKNLGFSVRCIKN